MLGRGMFAAMGAAALVGAISPMARYNEIDYGYGGNSYGGRKAATTKGPRKQRKFKGSKAARKNGRKSK